ncbi:N-acyl-D-amino-acid deacylase family protein [Sphingobium boeckii]|uniref:N-acyl-D-aspartate/D-glutamate deacylase n=1 Tax=Sphingobium boeckii TaxID=1082345 RepID=A0A7W9EGL0_9SPHN|nr:amidohydrolase family protein [Sphingobium boeckii]MBB5686826.1 N-acyl-D-aspartate/D-glutamate deacylase [Sphingobium boeckii]
MRKGRTARLIALAAIIGTSLSIQPVPAQADLLIRGGTIYTGTSAPFIGDVLIAGDRIQRVAPHIAARARRTIEAAGMIVAPGFIDPHTHADAMLTSDGAQERLVLPFLMQGVTTAFIGNDGGGGPNIARLFAAVADKPVGINFAAYVGFGSVRAAVLGQSDRTPTPDELAHMRQITAKAMCEGAIGVSTGLFYAPQSFAKTDEVVAIAREAAIRGGFYDSHIRDESSYTIGLMAAIEEAIGIGRSAKMPVHIAHIKALGADVQGQAPRVIAMVEAARTRGENVTADQYPWSASGTRLVAALIPAWAQEGGYQALRKRLHDPALAVRLRAEITETMRKRGGAASLLITDGPHKGRTVAQIAAAAQIDPIAAAIRLIQESDFALASFNQSEPDIAAFMKRPWVMTGSDASPGHPRVYGSFARKYAKYVVADRVITLRQFIERSATLTADTFKLKDRGRLRRGAFADVVIFDPKTYAARATYDQPKLFATGVQTVIVNGTIAIDHGKPTAAAPGRPLPHRPKGHCS